MFRILFLLFLLIPILEIFILIQVGGLIGAIPTILAIIGTAVLGAILLRQQGLSTFRRVQSSISQGEIPAIEMMEGVILLITGALLLTPGFFTDILGFLGLVPQLRRVFIVKVLKHVNILQVNTSRATGQHTSSPRPDTIEGEFRRED